MTLKEIKRKIDAAQAEFEANKTNADGSYNADAAGKLWDSWPRVYYKDLPARLKKEADKITIDKAKRFLLECYPVGKLDAIAADQTAFNDKIAEALHAARYLIQSIDTTPPKPTGNAAVDAATLEAFSPVSLIGVDFLEAWEKITSLAPAVISNTTSQLSTTITNNVLSNPYAPMFNGALVADFMQINTRGLVADKFTKRATFVTRDGHKFTIKNIDKLLRALSTPAKKIFNTAVIFLTAINYYETDRITPTVEIPLIEYGEACGYQLTPQKKATPEEQAAEDKAVQKRIKEFKKDVRSNLHDITNAEWTAEETKGRNKGDYSEMHIISSHKIVKGFIRINFDVDAATYLVHSYVMQHPTRLLAIDNRNPNTYVLGFKIAQHNSMDNNATKGTNNTLSVESLLAAAPEIQSYKDIQARGQRNWKDKIKKPLEKSLNELVAVGVLKKWEYRDPTTGKTYTPETVQPMTWERYNRLMVDFIMVNAPDQSERRAKKAQAADKEKADKEPKSNHGSKKKRGVLKEQQGGIKGTRTPRKPSIYAAFSTLEIFKTS